jgi:hypothetical protein
MSQAGGELKRHDRGIDVRQMPNGGCDAVRAAVVEQSTPPGGEPTPGKKNREFRVSVTCGLRSQFQRGPREPAVRALEDVEGEARQAEAAPVAFQFRGFAGIDSEVYSSELVRGESPGVLHGSRRRKVHSVDQNQDRVTAKDGSLTRLGRSRLQLPIFLQVLPVETQ